MLRVLLEVSEAAPSKISPSYLPRSQLYCTFVLLVTECPSAEATLTGKVP